MESNLKILSTSLEKGLKTLFSEALWNFQGWGSKFIFMEAFYPVQHILQMFILYLSEYETQSRPEEYLRQS